MKVSKYVTKVELNNGEKMLYSTLSRLYYVYGENKDSEIDRFLQEINKGVYTEEEIKIFKELVNKGMLVQDEMDELKKIEYLENSRKYDDNVYKIMIFATMECNFRCSYCQQNHDKRRLRDDSVERVLKLIKHKAQLYKKIELDWFGGEPLLEYKKVCNMLQEIYHVCRENGCELIVSMTTNGYLLDESKIDELASLKLKFMQITLDGNSKTHNERRKHISGAPTFDKILQNVILAANQGIYITLRVNIDEENKDDITEILLKIPMNARKQISVSVCNLFQNVDKYSTYELEKKAIELGYRYSGRWNNYVSCHAGRNNALVINTEGEIIICSNTEDSEKRIGYVNSDGKICIENEATYYNLATLSSIDNPVCRKCIQLPFCIVDCKYARMNNNEQCMGKGAKGLTIRERALLDYYSDCYKKDERRKNYE